MDKDLCSSMQAMAIRDCGGPDACWLRTFSGFRAASEALRADPTVPFALAAAASRTSSVYCPDPEPEREGEEEERLHVVLTLRDQPPGGDTATEAFCTNPLALALLVDHDCVCQLRLAYPSYQQCTADLMRLVFDALMARGRSLGVVDLRGWPLAELLVCLGHPSKAVRCEMLDLRDAVPSSRARLSEEPLRSLVQRAAGLRLTVAQGGAAAHLLVKDALSYVQPGMRDLELSVTTREPQRCLFPALTGACIRALPTLERVVYRCARQLCACEAHPETQFMFYTCSKLREVELPAECTHDRELANMLTLTGELRRVRLTGDPLHGPACFLDFLKQALQDRKAIAEEAARVMRMPPLSDSQMKAPVKLREIEVSGTQWQENNALGSFMGKLRVALAAGVQVPLSDHFWVAGLRTAGAFLQVLVGASEWLPRTVRVWVSVCSLVELDNLCRKEGASSTGGRLLRWAAKSFEALESVDLDPVLLGPARSLDDVKATAAVVLRCERFRGWPWVSRKKGFPGDAGCMQLVVEAALANPRLEELEFPPASVLRLGELDEAGGDETGIAAEREQRLRKEELQLLARVWDGAEQSVAKLATTHPRLLRLHNYAFASARGSRAALQVLRGKRSASGGGGTLEETTVVLARDKDGEAAQRAMERVCWRNATRFWKRQAEADADAEAAARAE